MFSSAVQHSPLSCASANGAKTVRFWELRPRNSESRSPRISRSPTRTPAAAFSALSSFIGGVIPRGRTAVCDIYELVAIPACCERRRGGMLRPFPGQGSSMFLRHIGALCSSASVFLVTIAAPTLLSCAQEQYPAALWAAEHPTPDAGAATDATPSVSSVLEGVGVCKQAHGEPLPARLEVMSASADAGGGGGTVHYATDLYTMAYSLCGMCHGGLNTTGNFTLSSASDLTASVLMHVTSAKCPMGANTPQDPGSPADPMPPCSSPAGGTYNPSDTTAPLVVFATLTQEWLAAGSPSSFTAQSASSSGSPAAV